MRDHVTEELISAYADGELVGDELKLVEDLLAESVEHQQLLVEFQSLRASMWALPTYKLPADLPTRVVAQIDDLPVAPSKGPIRRVSRGSKFRRWGSVLSAVASLAAVVVFTLMLRPAASENSAPSAFGSLQVFPVFFQDSPKYVMIYDVTITAAGQENKALDKLREKLGIGIDPALRLSKKVEEGLMAIRKSERAGAETEETPYKDDPATPTSAAEDRVEMIYIVGKLETLDQFGLDLEALRNVGEEVSKLHYDMALEPRKLGVMHRLHDAARDHFARNSGMAPADEGWAFRLAFDVELTSVSVPGAAAFPIPTILTNNTGPPHFGPPGDSGHILLIVRNVGAN